MHCNGVIDGVALFETLFVYPFTTKISIVNLTDDIHNFVTMLELRIWHSITQALVDSFSSSRSLSAWLRIIVT